jgi:hypothetical protein
MSVKAKSARDAFAFSLRGMAAISSYAIAPVIADDRVNNAWDERLRKAARGLQDEGRESGPLRGRFWLQRRYRSA